MGMVELNKLLHVPVELNLFTCVPVHAVFEYCTYRNSEHAQQLSTNLRTRYHVRYVHCLWVRLAYIMLVSTEGTFFVFTLLL